MLFTRTILVRFMALTSLGLLAAACGEGETGPSRSGSNLVYCDNPDAAAPSCDLPGYTLNDDSALRAKLDGCATGGCHGGALLATTWSLNLSGSVEDGLAALTNLKGTGEFLLVDDFDPDCSQMLSEVSSRPIGAVRMPADTQYWSTAEVDCFRSYLHEMYPQ